MRHDGYIGAAIILAVLPKLKDNPTRAKIGGNDQEEPPRVLYMYASNVFGGVSITENRVPLLR